MKKTGVLNRALAATIAGMGHTDLLVVADAGLPVPPGVPCIDLAVAPGVPGVLDALGAIAAELHVEAITIAAELAAGDTGLPGAVRALFPAATLGTVSHDDLKAMSARARAVVRTGECTPYANVVLASGVTF